MSRLTVGAGVRIAAALGVLLAPAACSNSPSLSSDFPSAVVPAGALRVSGNLALAALGDTTQLTATVPRSNGPAADVTAEAEWRVRNGSSVAMIGPGLFKAVGLGESTVSVTYAGASAGAAVRVAPPGAFLLLGGVSTFDGTGLEGARVDLASSLGTSSATTGTYGSFVLPAAGNTSVRVERAGYLVLERTMTVTKDSTTVFYLRRQDAAGASGSWLLTFTSSPSCPGPQRRTYPIDLEERQGNLVARGRIEPPGSDVAFSGTRAGDAVRFSIVNELFGTFSFVDGDVVYEGFAVGTVAEPRIAAAFNGSIGGCTATDHRMEMERR